MKTCLLFLEAALRSTLDLEEAREEKEAVARPAGRAAPGSGGDRPSMAGSGWEVGEKTTPRLANKEGCLEALVILSPFGRSASDELQRRGKGVEGVCSKNKNEKKTHTQKKKYEEK